MSKGRHFFLSLWVVCLAILTATNVAEAVFSANSGNGWWAIWHTLISLVFCSWTIADGKRALSG